MEFELLYHTTCIKKKFKFTYKVLRLSKCNYKKVYIEPFCYVWILYFLYIEPFLLRVNLNPFSLSFKKIWTCLSLLCYASLKLIHVMSWYLTRKWETEVDGCFVIILTRWLKSFFFFFNHKRNVNQFIRGWQKINVFDLTQWRDVMIPSNLPANQR